MQRQQHGGRGPWPAHLGPGQCQPRAATAAPTEASAGAPPRAGCALAGACWLCPAAGRRGSGGAVAAAVSAPAAAGSCWPGCRPGCWGGLMRLDRSVRAREEGHEWLRKEGKQAEPGGCLQRPAGQPLPLGSSLAAHWRWTGHAWAAAEVVGTKHTPGLHVPSQALRCTVQMLTGRSEREQRRIGGLWLPGASLA